MTEIERLAALGTRYLAAAQHILAEDKSGTLFLGQHSTPTTLAIAQIIATADRQIVEERQDPNRFPHDVEFETSQFQLFWEATMYLNIHIDWGEHLDRPTLGEKITVHEFQYSDNGEDFLPVRTGRRIVAEIMELRRSNDKHCMQYVRANILTKEGDSHD